MKSYEDYEKALSFEGNFQGEPLLTRARIHDNGTIHFHQGPILDDSGEGIEFRPDDIVGIGLEELKQVVEKAEEVIEE